MAPVRGVSAASRSSSRVGAVGAHPHAAQREPVVEQGQGGAGELGLEGEHLGDAARLQQLGDATWKPKLVLGVKASSPGVAPMKRASRARMSSLKRAQAG